MPPLRERVEDIPLLARSFFNRLQLKSGRNIDGIAKSAMRVLLAYGWPGNVRELKSAFEYAFVSCAGGMIEAAHLPPRLLEGRAVNAPPAASRESLEEVKRRRLADALAEAGGNRSEAARLLGISRTSVWKQMKKYKLG